MATEYLQSTVTPIALCAILAAQVVTKPQSIQFDSPSRVARPFPRLHILERSWPELRHGSQTKLANHPVRVIYRKDSARFGDVEISTPLEHPNEILVFRAVYGCRLKRSDLPDGRTLLLFYSRDMHPAFLRGFLVSQKSVREVLNIETRRQLMTSAIEPPIVTEDSNSTIKRWRFNGSTYCVR